MSVILTSWTLLRTLTKLLEGGRTYFRWVNSIYSIAGFHIHSFCGYEKDVLLLSKSTSESFSSFLGKGIIPLSPDFVFNSLRNPQLRFMYDNMLKVVPPSLFPSHTLWCYPCVQELYIVRNIEDGLFICKSSVFFKLLGYHVHTRTHIHTRAHIHTVHLHHETTQCFIKQARDFCILVSERSEVYIISPHWLNTVLFACTA